MAAPPRPLGDYALRPPAEAADWAAYHRIRRTALFAVFHPEVPYDPAHPDERRPGNHPLVLALRNEVLGTVRIDEIDEARAALRLVAIDRRHQRCGHGRALLALAEDFARSLGRRQVVLHANPESLGFYRRNGYVEHPWPEDAALGESVDLAKTLGATETNPNEVRK